MLVPAILYKEEIQEAFEKELYTEDYFYYTGYPYSNTVPQINPEDNVFQFAIVDREEIPNKLVGYLAYKINIFCDYVYDFGIYSFDKGNSIIGADIFYELERLIYIHHRIEWRMISGNPVKKHYDKFCNKHKGNITVLHDICKSPDGKYLDVYIYEIIKE